MAGRYLSVTMLRSEAEALVPGQLTQSLGLDDDDTVVIVIKEDPDEQSPRLHADPATVDAVQLPYYGTSSIYDNASRTELPTDKDPGNTPDDEVAPLLPSSPADTRGATLGQVQHLATTLGCALSPIPGGGFHLAGTFGEASYPTLGHVVAALRARAFRPLGEIIDPPTSDEYRRLRQQQHDAEPPRAPRSDPPAGLITAAMVEGWCLPGETGPECIARRRREAEASAASGPILMPPRGGGGAGRID